MVRDAPRPLNGHQFALRRRRRKLVTRVGLLTALILGLVLVFLPGLDLPDTLGFEAVLLAVAAVLFAVQHTAELDQVTDELRGVAESLPTQGIGVFPTYMGEIAELVGRTRQRLRIICDTPAHAAFSNTAAFALYWQNLGRLCFDGGNVTISCAFINPDGRKLMHEAQIESDKKDWEAWKKRNGKNCEAFQRFASGLRVGPPAEENGHNAVETWSATPEDYVESMMRINKAVAARLSHSMDIDWLPLEDVRHDGPNIYVWIRDEDQEAAFVIVPVPGTGVRDFAGFHTRAPELIRALNNVFEFQRKRAAHSPT
jgi:hypothetical protein